MNPWSMGVRTPQSNFYPLSMRFSALLVILLGMLGTTLARAATAPDPAPTSEASRPLIQLGPGDTVSIQVFGQSDLNANVYVSDDGTVPIALAGAVPVAGLSPSQAAAKIEEALRQGKFVKDPHVNITVVQSRSQRISVIGEVNSQGSYAFDADTTVFDLVAKAGGLKEAGAQVVYVVRNNSDGTKSRFPVDLRMMKDPSAPPQSVPTLRGGDVLMVPRADEFYIQGEVRSPAQYRIDPNMTLLEAVARAGGITEKGSMRRVEVKRRDASGKVQTHHMKNDDLVLPNDIIVVKESLF
jgi:polysaccharide export outer membrane protein